jgi:hypothetical protein
VNRWLRYSLTLLACSALLGDAVFAGHPAGPALAQGSVHATKHTKVTKPHIIVSYQGGGGANVTEGTMNFYVTGNFTIRYHATLDRSQQATAGVLQLTMQQETSAITVNPINAVMPVNVKVTAKHPTTSGTKLIRSYSCKKGCFFTIFTNMALYTFDVEQ